MEIEEDYRGKVTSLFPDQLLGFFSGAFEVVKIKRIKELMLKMLKLYQDMMFKFQSALKQFYESYPSMPIKFMVAQCNNFFRFWQLFQNLIQPMIEEKLATDDEI